MDPFDDLTGRWDPTRLPANIRVGEACFLERLESFARFRSARNPGLVIGARSRVFTWTAFSVEPEGLVEIGEDVVLVGAIVMCAMHIVIGSRTRISYNVTIADSDYHPLAPELRKLDAIANAPGGDLRMRPPFAAQPVVIGEEVEIGIGAIILKGVRVGNGARIAAGAVVTQDVPDHGVVTGNPARVVTG